MDRFGAWSGLSITVPSLAGPLKHTDMLFASDLQDHSHPPARLSVFNGLTMGGQAWWHVSSSMPPSKNRFRQLLHNTPDGHVHPVRPVDRAVMAMRADKDFGLVLEIAFEGLQRSSRHKSGVAMRFPRVHRIRWDKPARDADELPTLEKMLD
jgi:hypothetical protein